MNRKKTFLMEHARTLAIALPIALLLRVSVVEAYRIPSGSMEDTILVGDRLLADKLVYGARVPFIGYRFPALHDPLPGEVIIFESPREPGVRFIKRCIAVGGQTVMIRGKRVYVDGVLVALPDHGKIDPRHPSSGMDSFGPEVVPAGYLFVLGDNRDNSTDSRSWGYLSRDSVFGKALVVYWSWSPDTTQGFWRRIRWDRIGERIL